MDAIDIGWIVLSVDDVLWTTAPAAHAERNSTYPPQHPEPRDAAPAQVLSMLSS
jgi:hypothetical protein